MIFDENFRPEDNPYNKKLIESTRGSIVRKILPPVIIDGGVYIGQWKNCMRDGKGLQVVGLIRYDGDWLEDKFCGYGKKITVQHTQQNSNILTTYLGRFKDNKADGFGIYQKHHSNQYGYEFLGTFSDDKFNYGYAAFSLGEGGIYEGGHLDGKEHGYGEIRFHDGQYYKGYWLEGKYNGYGEYGHLDGKIYKGEWKNGDKNGKGKQTYANGSKYCGEFQNDTRHGYGVYVNHNGKYKGNWVKGRRHGYGVQLNNDGTKQVGYWKNGHFSRKSIRSIKLSNI